MNIISCKYIYIENFRIDVLVMVNIAKAEIFTSEDRCSPALPYMGVTPRF